MSSNRTIFQVALTDEEQDALSNLSTRYAVNKTAILRAALAELYQTLTGASLNTPRLPKPEPEEN